MRTRSQPYLMRIMLRVGFKKTTTIQQNSHSEMKWAEIWKKKTE